MLTTALRRCNSPGCLNDSQTIAGQCLECFSDAVDASHPVHKVYPPLPHKQSPAIGAKDMHHIAQVLVRGIPKDIADFNAKLAKEPLRITPSQPYATPTNTIETTLAERGARYGKFSEHAVIAQAIQNAMRKPEGWNRLAPDQKQALTVMADKIARMLNGDPDYIDNWHDIIGYAKLVEDRLLSKQ